MLGAFFIATDPVSAATSRIGQLIYGVGIGVFTFVIREYSVYPEGFAFAVLLMNVAMIILAIVYTATEARIQTVKNEQAQETLKQLLPDNDFDNDPITTAHWVSAAALGSSQPHKVYPAYISNKPVAAVLSIVAPNGYNGEIDLLLGIKADGTIIGSRVVDHSETPGLGDDVELRRSDWILQFNGKSLAAYSDRDWNVEKEGGKFDAFTGATITPRAVIHAVHKALNWFKAHPDEVFPG